MTDANAPVKTPWHLWVIGALSLLWNGYGGYDYVMTQTQNADYLAMFTDEQRAYYSSFPVWATTMWAIGVWGAVVGSVLLLLRSKWAVPVFGVALAAFIGGCVYMYAMSDGARIAGQNGTIMSGVIGVISLLELLYSMWLSGKGVLR